LPLELIQLIGVLQLPFIGTPLQLLDHQLQLTNLMVFVTDGKSEDSLFLGE
jgi:hypothetical protein